MQKNAEIQTNKRKKGNKILKYTNNKINMKIYKKKLKKGINKRDKII